MNLLEIGHISSTGYRITKILPLILEPTAGLKSAGEVWGFFLK